MHNLTLTNAHDKHHTLVVTNDLQMTKLQATKLTINFKIIAHDKNTTHASQQKKMW